MIASHSRSRAGLIAAGLLAGLCCAGVCRADWGNLAVRAGYESLLVDYPLVVVASWDPEDYQKHNADAKLKQLDRICLRVHRVIKGQCPRTVEVRFERGFSLNRSRTDGMDDVFWTVRADAPPNPDKDANHWAICCRVQHTNPGFPMPTAIVLDARDPMVYFLGRPSGFLRGATSASQPAQSQPVIIHDRGPLVEYYNLLRGEAWRPVPFPVPKPQDLPIGSAADPRDLVISSSGEFQPAIMADGFAAVLAGKQPDLVFIAFQDWFAQHQRDALAGLARTADRATWDRIVDEAIRHRTLDILDRARGDAFTDALLARLAKRQTCHYERLWGCAFSADPDKALAHAARLLAAKDADVFQKLEIISRIQVYALPADGGREAIVLAHCRTDPDRRVREAALKAIAHMLIDRGGTALDSKEYWYYDAYCCPGAMDKVLGALRSDLGQAEFDRLVTGFERLKAAVIARSRRGPHWAPLRQWPAVPELDLFKAGKFASKTSYAAWDALVTRFDSDSVIDTMVRALADNSVDELSHAKCLRALFRSAAVYPDKVTAALRRTQADNPDLRALRCYLDPATDPAPIIAGLNERAGPNGDRRRCHVIAVAATTHGRELLTGELAEADYLYDRQEDIKELARWFGAKAAAEIILAKPKPDRNLLPQGAARFSAPPPQVRAEALKLVTETVARADEHLPVRLDYPESDKLYNAVHALAAARDPAALKALCDLLRVRPYYRHSGVQKPWDYREILDALLAGDTPLYFKSILSLLSDHDEECQQQARIHESMGPLGVRFYSTDIPKELIRHFADRPHVGPAALRLEMLHFLGVKVDRPTSKEGIEMLAAAIFGQPGVPLKDYSRGRADQFVEVLAAQVVADEFGPRGGDAVEACRGLPEEARAPVLSGTLQRLAADSRSPDTATIMPSSRRR